MMQIDSHRPFRFALILLPLSLVLCSPSALFFPVGEWPRMVKWVVYLLANGVL